MCRRRTGWVFALLLTTACGRYGFSSEVPDAALDVDAAAEADAGRDAGTVPEVDGGVDAGPECSTPSSLADTDCRPVDGCPTPAICVGIILLHHFDEPLAEDTVRDASGLDHDASCTDMDCPTFEEAGRYGGAYRFQGTTHFSVPHTPELDAPEAVTMSAWLLPATLPANYRPLVTKFRDSDERSNYRLAHSGDRFYANFNDGSWRNHGGATSWPAGEWYHVVAVLENAGMRVRIWVNGTLDLDTTTASAFVVDDGPVWIGWAPLEDGVDGLIDDVAVWNRALTDEELASLYP